MSSSGQGSSSQQASASGAGTPITDPSQNLRYDLVSTLYHASQSNATIQRYIRDANQMGNNDAAQFFQSVAQQDQERAQKAEEPLFKMGSSSGSGSSH